MREKRAVDLFCGLGGWTAGLMAHGFWVVGFDIVRFPSYPGHLVIQDVMTLTGRQFRGFDLIVASPPCNEFTMFWGMNKRKPTEPSTDLVEHTFRIAREAGVPLILENVRDAQPWIGPARTHYDSFYLWGDGVPALMPRGYRRSWKQSKSGRDKARRAEIPLELSSWIARCYA